MKYVMENCVTEWAYTSGTAYRDPFNEVQLDVVFTDPSGGEHVVPAFWAGEQTWRVRYATPLTGLHHYRTVCSDPGNADLHGQTGTLEVSPYEGQNPLMMHGPLHMAADRRHLEHSDGTPFFWLGDTWWMARRRDSCYWRSSLTSGLAGRRRYHNESFVPTCGPCFPWGTNPCRYPNGSKLTAR